MFNRFLNHINSKKFFPNKKRILLAVSGGMDSMCLYDLMKQAGLTFSVGHVNHDTRSGMSDRDALFVSELCQKDTIEYHELKLDKSEFEEGNFQAKARMLRYDFFKKLDYDIIVTAHHKDDILESIMLNFVTGRSLNGIHERIDNIIRPLLIFRKDEIREYVLRKNLLYVEDLSNSQMYYERNFIRHMLIKPLTERNPDSFKKIIGLAHRIEQDQELLAFLVNGLVNKEQREDRIYFPIGPLIMYGPTLIFQVFRKEGFNRAQANDIFSSINTVGARFESNSHELIIDREHLVLKEKSKEISDLEFSIHDLPVEIKFGNALFLITEVKDLGSYTDSIAYFERSMINKKLTLRYWKEGDIFSPFGLGGHRQSLKKFFTNEKIDLLQKKSIPLIVNDNDIIWVVPFRTNEKYRSEPGNGPYLKIEYKSTLTE
ncbi:MAG: tRNA lysidine(34) synthetase TilS [Bacteroidia bacterium]|nr:tRNA lysidine(34) synthetase TilS [Bacteroidia bacterium]